MVQTFHKDHARAKTRADFNYTATHFLFIRHRTSPRRLLKSQSSWDQYSTNIRRRNKIIKQDFEGCLLNKHVTNFTSHHAGTKHDNVYFILLYVSIFVSLYNVRSVANFFLTNGGKFS